ILNCRDLGGFPTQYGITQFGRFLRAGVVATPTDEDIKALEEYGVKTVIDLRGDFETINTPTCFERINGVELHHISLYESNAATDDLEMTLQEIYVKIVEEYKHNIKALFDVIANAPDGVIMFHCFFGKDRTGILSMLLLTVAGAAIEDIIANYELTYTYILPYINVHIKELWNQNMSAHYSLAETISSLILFLDEKYGSVLNYIKSCGVTDEEIDKIRKRFFEKG
ncbi:MAG: tyrosine-protein phosphatase, partial [Ruminococcus sp.]|nr:tyrosine-protein phosphatase [Candidatus Copronaster equi]